MDRPQEPLGFRCDRFARSIRYSCLNSHSCGVHGWVTPPLHSPHDALLPICRLGPYGQSYRKCYNFGGVLEPRYIVGAESLDQ